MIEQEEQQKDEQRPLRRKEESWERIEVYGKDEVAEETHDRGVRRPNICSISTISISLFYFLYFLYFLLSFGFPSFLHPLGVPHPCFTYSFPLSFSIFIFSHFLHSQILSYFTSNCLLSICSFCGHFLPTS